MERLEELNARLAEFSPDDVYDHDGGDGLGLGLYVVARLAARHGARVRLREQKQGGIAAVVVLPDGILAAPPAVGMPGAVPAARAEAPLVQLPGSEAEANSNVLPSRSGERDPLIAAAETTLDNGITVWDAVGSVAITRISRNSNAQADVVVRDEPTPYIVMQLNSGETLTLAYQVTIQDPSGAIDTQDVTITILGTNDPVIVTSGP